MLRVGLTGGIGAGKSTVARRLQALGALIVDADQIARDVVAPGTPGLDAVVAEFGTEVLAQDGFLERSTLGRLVFADESRRVALNAIIHPRVSERRAELVRQAPADALVVEDIPLLVENGLAGAYPLVVVVHADQEQRVRRLGARGMDIDDARSRIRAQADDDARRAVADVWLDNSGPEDRLLDEVDALWRERLVPFEVNVRHRMAAERAAQPVITESDPTWPEQAARIAARVRHVAGDRALRIDHIGSTSVPGLAAKDVIDVQLLVADHDVADSVAEELIDTGLVRMGGRWFDLGRDGSEHDKVVACNADPARAVNLHVRPAESPAARDVVLLRDWLRATPDGMAEYATLKRRLAEDTYAEMNEYACRKTPWVDSALERADAWARACGWSWN